MRRGDIVTVALSAFVIGIADRGGAETVDEPSD
jgi:hypothetical protein